MSGWAEAHEFPLPPPANIDDVRSLNASKVTESLHTSPIGVTPGQTSQLGQFRAQLKVPYDIQGFYGPQILLGDSPRRLRSLKKQKSSAIQVAQNSSSKLTAVDFYADLSHLHLPNDTPIGKASAKRALKSTSIELKTECSMTAKKRGSLQAIFVPSFLQSTSVVPTSNDISSPNSPTPLSPTLSSRMRSASNAGPATSSSSSTITPSTAVHTVGEVHQRKRSMTFSMGSVSGGSAFGTVSSSPSLPRTSPPPDFLLDDDPFANLTGAPAISFTRSSSTSTDSPSASSTVLPPIPRSPLHEPTLAPSALVPPSNSPPASAPSSPPTSPRLMPSGRAQTRPAYQRPAFSSRPSLPSLDTLARMNVVLTKKPRKGRVGAGLPFEPWDNLTSDDDCTASSKLPLAPRPTTSPIPIRSNTYTTSPTSYTSTSTVSTPTNNTPINVNISSFSNATTIPAIPEIVPVSNPMDVHASNHPTLDVASAPSTPTMKPRPLLPSEILALGSLADDMEMVMPVPSPSPLRSSPIQTPVRVGVPLLTSPVPSSSSSKSILTPSPVVEEVEGIDQASSQAISSTSPTSPITFAAPENFDLSDELSLRDLNLAHSPASVHHVHAPSTSWSKEPILAGECEEGVRKEIIAVHSRRASLDVHVPLEEESYFGDFLDDYHRSSRNSSEDGHEQGLESSCVEEEPSNPITQDVSLNSIPPQPSPGYEPPGQSRSPPLSSMVFSSARSIGSNSASISLLSLSRSISSSTSFSSVESMDLIPAVNSADPSDEEDYAIENEGETRDGIDFDYASHLPGRNWEYRRFTEPTQSLSSLELDLEGGHHLNLDLDLGLGCSKSVNEQDDLERPGWDSSTRSSSSRPSLSRTRSSSDDSEVLQSPIPDDYLFFPHAQARARAQAPMISALEGQMDVLPQHPSSSIFSRDSEEVPSPWSNVLSDPRHHQDFRIPGGYPGLGNDGAGFEYVDDVDKVMVAGEDDLRGEKQEEHELSLAMDTRLANTSLTVASSNFDTSEKSSHFSPAGSDTLAPSFTTTRTTLITTSTSSTNLSHPSIVSASSSSEFVFPSASASLSSSPEHQSRGINMPMQTLKSPRANMMMSSPISKSPGNIHPPTMYMKQHSSVGSSQGEPQHSSGRAYHINGHQSSASITSQNTSRSSNDFNSSSRTGNRARGRRPGDSDDEDEEENERRRRRVLDRLYAVTKGESFSEDEEPDNYGHSGPPDSKMPLAEPWQGHIRSGSPSTAASFVTASSRSPSIAPMDFPASSGQSSRYESEDDHERDEDEDDDDDVPLARRIPGALTAQKSIRRQFREEREQRKKEKRTREMERERQTTLRPAGAGMSGTMSHVGGHSSSSHDAAVLATAAMNASSGHSLQRQRTQTLPLNSPPTNGFNPQDLARKLQSVQLTDIAPPPYQPYPHTQQQQHLSRAPTRIRTKSVSRTSEEHQRLSSPAYTPSPGSASPAVRSRSIREPPKQAQATPGHVPPMPTLRPMRSFHRTSERRPSTADEQPIADAESRLGRSTTLANRSSHESRRSPSLSRASGERFDRLAMPEVPVPPLPPNINNSRPSQDEQHRKLYKSHGSPEARLQSSRVSAEGDRYPKQQQAQLPSLNRPTVSQQRIFVVNQQQFHMVEIGPSTSAGDIIALLDGQGVLKGWAGEGGWMVFEVAQDFGMERPVRSYELLADVQSSWIKDKTVNYFVVRLTPLAIPLRRSNIPTSSPTHSGYIEWEVKRGKWSKRWLELREHSLWLSKRDNGKDEVFLCSLSNFDAYQITRAHRSPKPFSFAIKSTDNLSFFENTADYLHTFSASEKDGKIWMEKILIARSYVLHQERNVLFNPQPASGNASAAVTRSGTKKYAPRALPPLVAVPPLRVGAGQPSPKHNVFEPGSLLAKHN